jgi:hypothetical protein
MYASPVSWQKYLVVVSLTVAGETTHGKLSKEQTGKDRKEIAHVESHDSQHAIDY